VIIVRSFSRVLASAKYVPHHVLRVNRRGSGKSAVRSADRTWTTVGGGLLEYLIEQGRESTSVSSGPVAITGEAGQRRIDNLHRHFPQASTRSANPPAPQAADPQRLPAVGGVDEPAAATTTIGNDVYSMTGGCPPRNVT
jgi:hypothetical protein